jgi:uncharacterized protein YjcR
MAKPYSNELRFTAKMLFRRGYNLAEIQDELRVSLRALYAWREKYRWDDEVPANTVEEAVSRRICFLLDKPDKTREDILELDTLLRRLGELSESLAKARAMDRAPATSGTGRTGGEGLDEKPPQEKREKRDRKKKKTKNDISTITPEQLDEIRNRLFWRYQLLWWERKEDPATRRNRFILKSRQIGATYYFAWEALEDAIKTGDNQIFLSASRDQAEVFRAYIVLFGQKELGIELTGNPIILSNGAELRFLSTNSRTAQSYHGHLYLDEVFWIQNFAKMWKVASGMAAHKKWRRTLFSTPSALSHEAYAMWSGEAFNKGKADKDKKEFDVSHKALKEGWLGPDKIWRHIVTVEDAERQGCDLFDIEELRAEYSDDDFANLFMCKFIDDAKSVFSLALLLACGVEAGDWADYHPDAARPFGNKPVALGYDPSRSRDDASLVVMAVPLRPNDKWRVLKRLSFTRQSFQYQANRIKEIVDSHNVIHIGIDVSGMGWGVYELVQGFYPGVMPITYSVQQKTQLVVKALDVIQPPPRLEYDAGDKAITQAFLMIRQTTSDSGQITYAAARSGETGHADVAWAIMHAMIYEPLNTGGTGTTVAFSH